MVATPDRPVLSLADLEAFDPRPRGGSEESRFCCPLPACAGKPHDAAHRSLSLNVRTGAWQCHRCGAAGVLRDHWRPREQQQRAAARRAFALGPAAPPAPRPHRTPTMAGPVKRQWDWGRDFAAAVPLSGTPGAAYLEGRGIRVGVAAAAGVLYAPRWVDRPELARPGRPAVVFPIRDRLGRIVAAQGRLIAAKGHVTGGNKSLGVFATPGALDPPRVVICEAPIDALSLAVCGMPAVALCGKTGPDWLPAAFAFRSVAVAFDADGEGEKAVRAVAARMAAFGARVERWRPAGVKDWNDALRAHGPEALAAALGAADRGAGDLAVGHSPPLDDDAALPFSGIGADGVEGEDELDSFVRHLVDADGPPDAELWERVLTRAGALDGGVRDGLHAALVLFREMGCALTVRGDGRIHLGPFDDFAGCRWTSQREWEADYAAHLAPHERLLQTVMADVLGQSGTSSPADLGAGSGVVSGARDGEPPPPGRFRPWSKSTPKI